MSRTKRNSPKAHHNTFSNQRYHVEQLLFASHDTARKFYLKGHTLQLSQGGWKEAKRLLSKEDYSQLRKKQFDCFSKYVKMFTTPKYYRQKVEKNTRRFSDKEIKQYLKDSEYDVNNTRRYKLSGGYCWY